jgi:hypothetical protein
MNSCAQIGAALDRSLEGAVDPLASLAPQVSRRSSRGADPHATKIVIVSPGRNDRAGLGRLPDDPALARRHGTVETLATRPPASICAIAASFVRPM